MLILYKILVTLVAFITLLVLASSEKHLLELMSTKTNTLEEYRAEIVFLSTYDIEKFNETVTGYIYRCSAGNFNSDQLEWSNKYHYSYHSAKDVQEEIHYPTRDSNAPVSYFVVSILSSSPNVDCVISDGGINLGYIVVTLKAGNTTDFAYAVDFYR